MSNEVITKSVPDGWLVKVEWEMDGQDVRPFYRAYRWHNVDKSVARKRLWRKAQESGWKRTIIVHRHLEDTMTEITATVKAEGTLPIGP